VLRGAEPENIQNALFRQALVNGHCGFKLLEIVARPDDQIVEKSHLSKFPCPFDSAVPARHPLARQLPAARKWTE
jgi:hypothetical protein